MPRPETPATLPLPPDLDRTWTEALERMTHTTSASEQSAVMDISLRQDPDQLSAWRQTMGEHITPESSFFLKMSEAAKREKQDRQSRSQ